MRWSWKIGQPVRVLSRHRVIDSRLEIASNWQHMLAEDDGAREIGRRLSLAEDAQPGDVTVEDPWLELPTQLWRLP